MELPRSFSYNTEPEKELRTLATREGSPRIDNLSPEERTKLFSWYLENFDDISGEEQAGYLEEFIQNGLVTDREARELVVKMDHWEKAQVGEFIAKVMAVTQWRETFQECFRSLEIETQVECIADLIERPEALPVIAPFISPGDKRLSFVTERDGRSKQVSIDKYFYSSPSEAIPLFESLVTYFERHQDEVIGVDPEFGSPGLRGFMSALIGSYPYHKDTLRRWVEDYANESGRETILPFVERLHALGELSDSERETLYTPKEETWTDSLLTRTGRETLDEQALVEKGMHDVADSKFDDSYISSVLFEQMRPRENAIKRFNIIDKGNKKEVAAISERFQDFREHISDIPDFLCGLCVGGYPVLLELEQLGVTKQEVAQMFAKSESEYSSPLRTFDGSDVVALLDFNKTHEDGPDLEEVLLRHLETLLHRDKHEQGTLTQLIFNLYNIWPQLSQKLQEGLLSQINAIDPSVWMFNPAFALEHVFKNPNDFTDMLTANPEQFFYEYQYLRHTIAHGDIPAKERELLLKNMEAGFCSILEKEPALILSAKQSALCESMLPREKLVEILRGLIQPFTPPYQLRDLIHSKYFDDMKEEVQELAKEEAVFVGLSAFGRSTLDKLFGRAEFAELLKKYFSKIDISNVLVPSSLRSEFSKKEIKDFVVLASEDGSENQLCELSERLLKYESERKARPDRLKKEIAQQNDMMAFLKKQLEQVSPRSYKTAATYESQIAEKTKRIKELQQKLLESVTEESYDSELQMAKEILIEKCQRDPELVFREGVVDVLDGQAEPFIRASVHEYSAKHPEILKYSNYSGFGKTVDELMGRDEYGALLKKHSRFLVFGRQRTPGYCSFGYEGNVPFELQEIFTSIDPFYNDSHKFESDYYDTILGNVDGMAYCPLASDALTRIAKEQQSALGIQKEQITPPQEFAELVLRVAALETSPLAKNLLPEVAKLPLKEQQQMIELLFVAARHNFDEELTGDSLSLEEVSTYVAARLRGQLAGGLDISESLLTDQFSLKTLQSFSEFYETGLKDSETGKNAFTSVLTALTKYPYEDWKLWGGDSPKNDAEASERLAKLQSEKLIPAQMTLEAYQAWCAQSEYAFDEMLTYEIGDVVEGVRRILDNAIADGHITHEAVDGDVSRIERELEALMEPLKEITNQLQYYVEAVKRSKNSEDKAQYAMDEENYRRLKEEQQTYRIEHGDKLDTLTAQLYLNRLRNLTAEELRAGAVRFMKKEVRFDRVFKAILEAFKDEFPGITEDIFRIQQTVTEGKTQVFGEAKVSRKRLSITDSVDFDTAFHIGQYPVPSCQSFASSMGYNEGLLSYVADPSTHIIQVWDEDKKLIARSVIRLMEDKEKRPAIFAERIYSVNAHHKITEAIMSFAKQKAERVGARLYTSQDNSVATKGTAALFNSGTRSSATYSDAGGGFVRGGVFRIGAAREV